MVWQSRPSAGFPVGLSIFYVVRSVIVAVMIVVSIVYQGILTLPFLSCNLSGMRKRRQSVFSVKFASGQVLCN